MAVAIALGSNISDGIASEIFWLRKGLMHFSPVGLKLTKISRGWVSPSWPLGSGADFINAVAFVETDLEPIDVLHVLLDIEAQCQRVRTVKNAPRTLDLDLIDYHGLVMNDPHLILPHPRAHERQFVLGPLMDLDPDWRHPTLGASAAVLFARCDVRQAARPVYAAADLWRNPEKTCL